MRIIKKEPEKKMLCHTCGCEFAYTEKDVNYVGNRYSFRIFVLP